MVLFSRSLEQFYSLKEEWLTYMKYMKVFQLANGQRKVVILLRVVRFRVFNLCHTISIYCKVCMARPANTCAAAISLDDEMPYSIKKNHHY